MMVFYKCTALTESDFSRLSLSHTSVWSSAVVWHHCRADESFGDSQAFRACESGGGPPHSVTLREVRRPSADAPASWSAPALWRFGIIRRNESPTP